jgi:hypothetical protein
MASARINLELSTAHNNELQDSTGTLFRATLFLCFHWKTSEI